MASGSLPPSLTAALLLCCATTSALTTLLVHLYLRPAPSYLKRSPSPQKSTVQSSQNSSPTKVSTKAKTDVQKLKTLADNLVPQSLQLQSYFSPGRLQDFDHARLFDNCSSVLAVLDRIRPYLTQFFQDNLPSDQAQITTLQSSTRSDSDGRGVDEESDSSDEDLSPRRRRSLQLRSRWHLPEWIDPSETAEIVIYPGVRAETFAPQKVVNLEEGGKPITGRRPSTESNGTRKPSYGWSRSSVEEEDEEPVLKKRLIVLPEAVVMGGTFDLTGGSIYIGKQARIEPDVVIKGPAIIGARTTLRSGAYIRGDVIVGRNVVLRGEVKNSVIMDDAELCHPGYCGDSICGFKSHFGNQVTTANLSLMGNGNLTLDLDGVTYDTDPCTLIQQNTVVYPLTRLPKGVYGSSLLIKNKPLEKGVLEIVPLQPSEQK